MKRRRVPDEASVHRRWKLLFLSDKSTSARKAEVAFSRPEYIEWSVKPLTEFDIPASSTRDLLVLPAWRAVLERWNDWPRETAWIAYGAGEALVTSLRLGAADIVVEPWTAEELHLRARCRLSHWRATLPVVLRGGVLSMDGRTVRLTPLESRILETLLRNAPGLVPRDTLSYMTSDRSLRVVINRLRGKLGGLISKSSPNLEIQTEYGRGYRFIWRSNVDS